MPAQPASVAPVLSTIDGPNGPLSLAVHGDLGECVVVSCHGMLSNKDGAKHQTLAQLCERAGLACVRFDFTGRGASGGTVWELSYQRDREDLEAVITHLAAQGVQRFALFGSSMGGTAAFLAAGRDERIVALATLGAVAHPELTPERRPEETAMWRQGKGVPTELGEIGPAFLEDSLEHDVLFAARVLRIPVFVLHGDRDEVVPCSDAHDLAAAAKNARLEVALDCDHRYSDPARMREAMGKVLNFLQKSLLIP